MSQEATKDIIPLEEGLYMLAKKQINQEPDFLHELGVSSVEAVDKALFDRFRNYKFVKIVRYAYEHSKFYKRLYDEHGVDIDSIRSIEDISKLPFTSPKDLALYTGQTDSAEHGGTNSRQFDFLCTSQSKVERAITFTTSGTVGPKKRIFFSENDIDAMTDFMAVGMNTVMDEQGVTQIFLPPGPQMGQADLLSRGVKKMKGQFVVTGMLMESKTQIETIIEKNTTVLFGETRLMYRITKDTENEYDLASLGVKTIFVTTSYLCETMRTYLEKAWNARVTTHYGLVEMGLGVAVECGRDCGYHYDELDVIAETVDPETGNPMKDGEIGEMAFTSLSRDVMPLIRYKNRDLAYMVKHNPKCDGLEIIGPVHTRIESLVSLGNDHIYPTYFDDILFTIEQLIDYEVHLYHEDGKDRMELLIETVLEGQDISDEVLKLLSQDTVIRENKIPVSVQYVPRGTMKSETHYKKLIKDHRSK